jgi:hypothetical protein
MDPVSPNRRLATDVASVKTTAKYLHERLNEMQSRLIRVERVVWGIGGAGIVLQFLRGCL